MFVSVCAFKMENFTEFDQWLVGGALLNHGYVTDQSAFV